MYTSVWMCFLSSVRAAGVRKLLTHLPSQNFLWKIRAGFDLLGILSDAAVAFSTGVPVRSWGLYFRAQADLWPISQSLGFAY